MTEPHTDPAYSRAANSAALPSRPPLRRRMVRLVFIALVLYAAYLTMMYRA
jgi:hypothetical protein